MSPSEQSCPTAEDVAITPWIQRDCHYSICSCARFYGDNHRFCKSKISADFKFSPDQCGLTDSHFTMSTTVLQPWTINTAGVTLTPTPICQSTEKDCCECDGASSNYKYHETRLSANFMIPDFPITLNDGSSVFDYPGHTFEKELNMAICPDKQFTCF